MLRSLCLVGALVAPVAAHAETAPAAPRPEVFAPGVISGPANDADPAFSPDGNTVWFARHSTIVVSRKHGATWSAPEVAAFSGEWADQQPTISPDGAFLVFVSNRPAVAGDKPVSGNLWRVDLRTPGAAPVHLPAAVNRGPSIWAPSIAGDGSLYFIERAVAGGPLRILRSQLAAGQYQPATHVSFGDETTQDVDPAIAPDESFLVFGSMHPGPDAHERLFIAFRAGAGWSKPIDLGVEVNGRGDSDTNEARLGPDHRTLYFATDRSQAVKFPRPRAQAAGDLARIAAWDNGSQNIWRVSLAPWLDAHR